MLANSSAHPKTTAGLIPNIKNKTNSPLPQLGRMRHKHTHNLQPSRRSRTPTKLEIRRLAFGPFEDFLGQPV